MSSLCLISSILSKGFVQMVVHSLSTPYRPWLCHVCAAISRSEAAKDKVVVLGDFVLSFKCR